MVQPEHMIPFYNCLMKFLVLYKKYIMTYNKIVLPVYSVGRVFHSHLV